MGFQFHRPMSDCQSTSTEYSGRVPADGGSFLPCSVVIPVKERHMPLLAALESIFKQTAAPSEVIIVDQSRDDACEKVLNAAQAWAVQHFGTLPGVTYLRDSTISGAAAARNEGLRRTTQPFVVFTDDDARLHPDALKTMIAAFQADDLLLAGGGIITNYQKPRLSVRLFRRVFYAGSLRDERQPVYWHWRRYSSGTCVLTTKLTGCFMAFRTAPLRAAGGFDGRYIGASIGEDVEIAQRLRGRCGRDAKIALVGGAFVHHDSLGGWKVDAQACQSEIVAWHYALRRLPRWSAIQLSWLMMGIGLLGVVDLARRRGAGRLVGLMGAVRCIRSDYSGCTFLDSGRGKRL
jgi:GT2 family glycosyltransferase